MRATEITAPMLLLSEQERQVVRAQVSQGLSDHKQKSYASAARCFTQAAKLGHPVAQYVLGVYYASGIGVPKDEHMAFQLYLEAARHGNTDAQRRAGECYLSGRGVAADLETGLAWLETAGQGGDAKACERLAQLYGSTKLRDGEKEAFWRARLEELQPTRPGGAGTAQPAGRSGARAMPPLGPQADLFQRRELYQNGGSRSGTAGITNGKFYYLSKDENGRTKLCESELDGSGARVLADVEGYDGARLAATSVSVFLYQTGVDDRGNTVLQVREVPLDNGMPREFCLEADDWTARSVYVYCSSLFYVLEQKGMCCLCAFYAETATRRVLYRRASAITEVYGGADYVVFRARYENGDLAQEGWMRYDLHTGEVQSLDYAISPENVLDHPEYYDEDSRSYVRDADCRERDIVFSIWPGRSCGRRRTTAAPSAWWPTACARRGIPAALRSLSGTWSRSGGAACTEGRSISTAIGCTVPPTMPVFTAAAGTGPYTSGIFRTTATAAVRTSVSSVISCSWMGMPTERRYTRPACSLPDRWGRAGGEGPLHVSRRPLACSHGQRRRPPLRRLTWRRSRP